VAGTKYKCFCDIGGSQVEPLHLDIAQIRNEAEGGSCVSQCQIGLCYLYGLNVEINYQEAFRFLSAAAEQGASRAILNLGRMYAQGLAVGQNAPEAIRRFEDVAWNTVDAFSARIEMGRLYARGLGVPVDKAKALHWYSLALEIAAGEDSLTRLLLEALPS
jgi:TPR repeat protein